MTGLFTGAGISGDEPAALPRGFGLRDDVLATMHEAACRRLPTLATDDQLDRLRGSGYKLEVVLGRLWGTVGEDALDCVFALRVRVPNEAHMLAALHLARGGAHVTVNFDVGIELAHDLIRGHADLPPDVPRAYHDALPAWRALAPPACPALRTVSSHAEFAAWSADGRPPALLKIHGGLDRNQTALSDVVLVDIEELAQLTPERAAAVDGLAACTGLLITGYSGGDPDVYAPLLAAATRTDATWCCLTLPADSAVPADTHRHGIRLVLGDPDGLAVTALRKLLGAPAAPPWPSVPLPGDGYRERFIAWRKALRAAHPPELIARSWAWLLADLGDLDTAEAMLSELPEDTPGTRLRHAEILYTRAQGDDRDSAGRMFRQVAKEATDDATRLHCLLRLGDVARNRAASRAGGAGVLADLAEAYLRPLHVVAATRNGRRAPEQAADAYRALQQTSLRLLEELAARSPRRLWPVVALLCAAAARCGGQAARLARNGNRLALVRQHRAMLRALGALLRGRPAPQDARTGMRALHATYRAADDPAGAANCTVTLAVLAAADGEHASARTQLAQALAEYGEGRPPGRPLPAGKALVAVMTRLLSRVEK